MGDTKRPQTMSTHIQLTPRLRPATARLHVRAAWLPLLLLLTLTLSTAVQAQFGTSEYDTIQGNGAITITLYNGAGGDVTVPGTLRGLPVDGIGDNAFIGIGSLTSVTIPNSVTSILRNPFLGCTGLTRFTVEAGNSSYASVDGVLFDKSRTTLIQYPPAKVVADYNIPDSVTSIGNRAFFPGKIQTVRGLPQVPKGFSA